MNMEYLVDKLSGEDGHLKGEPKLLSREMKEVGSSEEGKANNSTIRIFSWNMLADALTATEECTFTKCPPEALSWDIRRFRVLEEILTHKPDIVCLQECDHYDDFIAPALGSVSFLGAFVPKPTSPGSGGANWSRGIPTAHGCCICYLEDKFKPIKTETLTLQGPDGKESSQVAILTIFRVLGEDKQAKGPEFCVVNTHLKSKPECAAVRVEQAKFLLGEIKSKIGGGNMPLIICGDFNAPPDEETYKVMSGSELKLTSAYTKLGAEPEFTTWKVRNGEEQKRCIDYVWYSEEKFACRALLQLPTADGVGEGRLPSRVYPSDHCSLLAQLQFKQ